ncbi:MULTISPECIES: sensor histidine kinase [Amycolatopsis]|nr:MULTISPECIES: histidine kinase [Amycolatopsis]
MSQTIVSVAFGCLVLIGLVAMIAEGLAPGLILLCAIGSVALLAVQLLYFGRPGTAPHSPLSHWMLLAQLVLAYLPLVPAATALDNMLAFPAGTALLVLGKRAGPLVYVAVNASVAVIYTALGISPLLTVYETLANASMGLAVFLLTGLARTVSELHAARTELANGAVAEERLHFARELHDLLGQSLSAIALRGEFTRRLVRTAPARARDELAGILDLSRRALADVRSVASGYRELSLEQEFRAAESLLSEAEVDLRLELDERELPVQVRTVLTAVLRESIANILRHSDAGHCRIAVRQEADQVSLDVANDGTDPEESARDGETGGKGLADVTARVSALGGEITAGPEPGGRFQVRVRLPLDDPRPLPAARKAPRSEESASRVGVRLAGAGVAAVLVSFAAGAVLHVMVLTGAPWQITLTAVCLGALVALQLAFFSRPAARLPVRRAYALLFVQVCLVYLPLLELREVWVSFPGLLICNAHLLMRPAAAWFATAAVLASMAGVHAGFDSEISGIPFNVLATVNTGFVAFGVTWLSRLVAELDGVRRRLAGVAVAEERLRFARDLHDLLGLSLSAIALKTELTEKLLRADPGRADAELAEILTLSRQALADVRSVADGYRELSLESESRSAEAVLTAVDVRVRMEVQQEAAAALAVPVRTVLAVVLREGVTNMLRHSKVENCEIAVRQSGTTVCLEIVNDGVEDGEPASGGTADPETASGNGIANLSERVTTLGGELTAGLQRDGRFRLRAEVPAAA